MHILKLTFETSYALSRQPLLMFQLALVYGKTKEKYAKTADNVAFSIFEKIDKCSLSKDEDNEERAKRSWNGEIEMKESEK